MKREHVLIAGAGIAGLVAAWRLSQAGFSVEVFEARSRVGGRLWTSYIYGPFPVELGAEFIHGDRVITWRFLERYGLHAVDDPSQDRRFGAFEGRPLPSWELSSPLGEGIFAPLDRAAEAWYTAGNPDVDLATALRWYAQQEGFTITPSLWELWQTLAAIGWSVDLERIGVYGEVEATITGDGLRNWRIAEGQQALAERLAQELNGALHLECPVEEIQWGPDGVSLITAEGVQRGRWCIVALPLGVLKATTVRFVPTLPDDVQEAIDGLDAGQSLKIVVELAEDPWGPDIGCLLVPTPHGIWERPGHGFHSSELVFSLLVGGSDAIRLAALPEDEAIREVVTALGTVTGYDLGGTIRRGQRVDWTGDPWCQGGYSVVPPGGSGLRQRFAEVVGDSLLFAGEYASVERPGTVHGAIESGLRVAEQIVARSTSRAFSAED